MTKESLDKSMKIISTHYLMVTNVQKVTYFRKISVSNYIGEDITLSFLLLKYWYPYCGEDIILFITTTIIYYYLSF